MKFFDSFDKVYKKAFKADVLPKNVTLKDFLLTIKDTESKVTIKYTDRFCYKYYVTLKHGEQYVRFYISPSEIQVTKRKNLEPDDISTYTANLINAVLKKLSHIKLAEDDEYIFGGSSIDTSRPVIITK